jgi:hypothetical protein
MTLDPRQHQGHFGEAFVRVLAAAAGLTVAKAEPDVTGDDFTLGYKGTLGKKRHPKIDVQVKSWRRSNAVYRADAWHFRLQSRHFNELAGTGFSLPRFLFLVIVPDDWRDYAVNASDAVHLRDGAYWVSLADREPVPPEQSGRVPVVVPAANVLTVPRLRELMLTRTDDEGSS